jgi:hypothetical protein
MTPTLSETFSQSLSLKVTMRKRYNVSQQALDLKKLRFDLGMMDLNNSRAYEDRGVFLGGRHRDSNLGEGVSAGIVQSVPSQFSDSLLSAS